jgi:predicted glycosyltransferase
MVDSAIGYYVHHHGAGHVTRALAIAEHMEAPITLFGSNLPEECHLSNVSLCHLPLDFDADTVVDTPAGLHYAPLAVDGLRERMGMLVDWFRSNWPCLLVVDVSVEVALLARLLGVPTVYMRQRGHRVDAAHSLAYASATRLLAPYSMQFEEPGTPTRWTHKTDYAGSISRYRPSLHERSFDHHHVTVITGRGGTDLTLAQLASAARSCPEWQWTVLGPVAVDSTIPLPSNLKMLGVVGDPLPWLSSAHVVVGSAGDSLVGEFAALRCRFICIPETRPFDEQQSVGKGLAAAGLAIYCPVWPGADSWPSLLAQAIELLPERWGAFMDGDGALRAARAIKRAARARPE